ncbi:methyltransferase family protein [Halomarina litorea]|uniref:methyltransferase family protein n=1 Tax=Halomarina litorea TaxID=2961595 RepID=UPI0020C1F614|nr:methyltransferase [Halomarina sp. BCD28]
MIEWIVSTHALQTVATTGIGIAACALLAAAMVISIRAPNHRLWPPGDHDWRFGLYLILSGVVTVTLGATAYLDWRHLSTVPSLLLPVGEFIAGLGLLVTVASMTDLGVRETSGLPGEFRTDGFYQYSRNPQIVGLLFTVGGLAVTGNSLLGAAMCITAAVWLVLMPFAEEPWLRDHYGDEYEQYREAVPRS